MNKPKFTPIIMPVGNKYGCDYFVTKSYKVGRIATFYSNLEFKNWLTLEINPEVLAFCEQPYKAEMFINGKKKETIFDMWVLYKNGVEEFQEVKYNDQLINPKNKEYTRCTEQVEFQRKWCKANNMKYIIRTENDIEQGQYHMENLLHMSSCIKNSDHVNAKSFYGKIRALLNHDAYTLGNLHRKFSNVIFFDEFLSIIAFAYNDGVIDLNLLNDSMGLNTEVKLYGK